MKKSRWLLLAVVVFAYIFLFLRNVPRADLIKSNYSVSCNAPETGFGASTSIYGFGEIPGRFIALASKNGRGPKNWQYKIIDPDWDVASKVTCVVGNPTDPAAFIKNIRSYPHYAELSQVRANYTVILTTLNYSASITNYCLKIIFLLITIIVVFQIIK